ncbi:hypothetical protein Tco_1501019 [Tanacetum coccineum]
MVLRADYGFVATMDRQIRRDPERYVGYGIKDSWDEIVETLQGAPVSTDTELGAHMREFESMVRQDTDEIYTRLDDEQGQRQLLAGRVNMLFRDRRTHAHTRQLMETEALHAQMAEIIELQSADRRRQRAMSDLLETDHRRREEIRQLRAADRTRQQQIVQTLTVMQTLQKEMIPLQGLGQQGPAGGPAQPGVQRRLRVLILEMTFVGVESRVLIPEMTFVGVESRVLIPETTFVGVESRVLIPETTVWDTLVYPWDTLVILRAFAISPLGLWGSIRGYMRDALCGISYSMNTTLNGFNDRTFIICDKCEKEYHIGCLRENSIADLKELAYDKVNYESDMIHYKYEEDCFLLCSGLLFCPLEVVNEAHDQCMEEKKEVDFDGQEVEKDVDYSKEIESDGQHEKKDVKGEIEIARAALIQQEIALITKEIALGLWSWDDLNSEGDGVEGVLGVGGDGSNSLKTVDRLSKSDEVRSDNVVRGFKDVKSLSSKRISVSNIVSDNDDMVADSNNSKVGKCIERKYVKFKNGIVVEKKMSAQKPSVPTKKGKHKGKGQTADTGNAIADCHKVVSDILADGKSDDVESCDVKKGKSLLSKRRRVYNVVSDDDDTVADDNKVYVADNVVNDKKKSIKRATKRKAITGCDKVFLMLLMLAIIKSLSSKGKRVLKGVSVDLTADDNKVIKPDDGFLKFENVDVDSYSIQENVESLQLIPQQQPGVEEELLDMQIMPIEDHVDASATLERLSVGYRKGNGPNQPLESTLLKTGFSPTWRLLMAYISNSLGGNIGSKDQLNYMHQLIAHGLINGVKLDYGGIIFNDLAAKLTNSVRHTSPAYVRFISLILEKALGDSYVLYDEIGLKIPIMGNSIFNIDPSLLEVPISSHMVRVCQSEPDSAVVSEDVAGILLCDNVSDGSPSIDTNLNEIVQKVKTKSINSLLDPKLKESTGVYEYKVVSNCLNEEVVADTAVAIDYDSVQSYIYFLEVVGDIAVGTASCYLFEELPQLTASKLDPSFASELFRTLRWDALAWSALANESDYIASCKDRLRI